MMMLMMMLLMTRVRSVYLRNSTCWTVRRGPEDLRGARKQTTHAVNDGDRPSANLQGDEGVSPNEGAAPSRDPNQATLFGALTLGRCVASEFTFQGGSVGHCVVTASAHLRQLVASSCFIAASLLARV